MHHIFKWQIRSKGKNKFIGIEPTVFCVRFHDSAVVVCEAGNDLVIEHLGNIITEYIMNSNTLISYQENSCLGNLWIWYLLISSKNNLNLTVTAQDRWGNWPVLKD